MSSSLRQSILEALPRPLAKSLYLIRNSEVVIRNEALDGYFIELGVPKRNRLWIKRLHQKEGHEIGICQWLEKYLRDEDVFFDVGAAFGFFPALISQINPQVGIHAFEAGWQQFIFLQNNAKRHKSARPWVLNNKFVGDKNEGNFVSLDGYSQQKKVTPTLVKMDVDGFEYGILKGAKGLIDGGKTEFLVEIHPSYLKKYGSSSEEVMALFPKDYVIKVLPNIREGVPEWSDDLSLIHSDQNPYVYLAPPAIARFG